MASKESEVHVDVSSPDDALAREPMNRDNDDDAPPSYDSLFGKIKAAKAGSSNVGFFKSFFVILGGSIGCTLCMGIMMAIPIAMMVIGSMKLHDCPAERYIPIYLIVAGVFGCVKCLLSMIMNFINRRKDDDGNKRPNPIDGCISCFLLAWFIAGNYWIYHIHGKFQSDVSTEADYCDHLLYWFAFWITTASYILMVTFCCCACCLFCIASAKA